MLENIKSDVGYNLGGITSILLLDKDEFQGFEFDEDDLYDRFNVTKIFRTAPFLELDRVEESSVNQNFSKGVYKHELKSFIRIVRKEIIRTIEYAKKDAFVVFFKTMQGRYFTLGSDGGVTLSYSLQTDEERGVNGMTVEIKKSSIYPLFEVREDAFKTPSHFVPDFTGAYCVGSDYQPQFHTGAYCMRSDYQPQFDRFICQTI